MWFYLYFYLPNDGWKTPSYGLLRLVIIWSHSFLPSCYSNVVQKPPISASPGNLFELQTLRHPQPTELGHAFKEILADLFEIVKLKKYCSTKSVLEWPSKLYFPTKVERMVYWIPMYLSPNLKNKFYFIYTPTLTPQLFSNAISI